MARIVYGVWNNQVHDNRKKLPVDIEDSSDVTGLATFNEGNPIQAFCSDKGFLVFDKNVNLLDAMWQHMTKAAAESCGKCTPCRMGTKLIMDKLDHLRQGQGDAQTWKDIAMLAEQVQSSSLCGLGQTCATALIGALEHFRDQLEADAKKTASNNNQNGMAYMTAPCIEACPSKVNVPRYISYLRDGKPTHSMGVILQKYPMAATCGRVCLHFCEMACRRNLVDEAVSIKTLKRYVADYQMNTKTPLFSLSMVAAPQPAAMKIAVVGAGPAGIACAYHLLLKGYHVDILEATKLAGGMAERGIPSYRLPKEILKTETDIIETLGGRIVYGKALGRDFSVNDLFEQGYKATFLAIGCAQGARMGVEGEDESIEGCESGIDFLLKVHHHVDGSEPIKMEGEVIIVGGGNVAMDCARSSIRLGAKKVHLVYRRTKADMPADKEEIEAAEKEGIIFHYLTNPSKVVSKKNKLVGIEVSDMRQTDPDESGRRGVEAIPDSTHMMKCSIMIAAIGQQIDRNAIKPEDGIKVDKRGLIQADNMTQTTSRPGVFAGGDASLGPATLIHAMANGLTAARSIEDYLHYGQVRFSPIARMRQIIKDNKLMTSDYVDVPVKSLVRVHHPELDPNVRREMFEEVELSISPKQAYDEAHRCMRCYRVYSLITESPIPEGHTPETNSPAAP